VQRVFIGIPVDKPAQRQINELLIPAKRSNPDIRWVPEHNRHLTLAFLGNRPTGVIKDLVRSMHLAFQQQLAFRTGFSTLRRFPTSTGNIIALVYKPDEYFAHLFQVTQDFLTENGLGFDLKPFRPHITLGRIRKASTLKITFNQETNIGLRVDKVALYQSTLTDTGSIYLALKEIELGHTGAHPL
jgi:2'-5' RNA ligase